MSSTLKEYKKKRNFDKTREPSGKNSSSPEGKPLFVIQQHDASNLHFDFRIQVGNVLKSWAVPKGPSTDPGERRLAMATEDHPLEYADFEGVIPEDEYGGGTVIVWDKGTYRNLKDDNQNLKKNLENGEVTIWLEGEKIKGGYALIRTGKGKDARWLMIKMDDDEADARRNPVSTETRSVLSGRTLKDVAEEENG